jgi:hypothetical protein
MVQCAKEATKAQGPKAKEMPDFRFQIPERENIVIPDITPMA